jgi:hypothetical protein
VRRASASRPQRYLLSTRKGQPHWSGERRVGAKYPSFADGGTNGSTRPTSDIRRRERDCRYAHMSGPSTEQANSGWHLC